jgi:hypothetical protein
LLAIVVLMEKETGGPGWGIIGLYVHDPDEQMALRIDRAEPWSYLSAEEIRVLHEHPDYFAPAVALRCAGDDCCPGGDVLTLAGANQRVVYRLAEPLPGTGAWVMKWPD